MPYVDLCRLGGGIIEVDAGEKMNFSGEDEEVVAHDKLKTESATSSKVQEILKPPPGSISQ